MRVTFIAHFCCVTICAGAWQTQKNIVELAQGINSLSTLVTALKAGNLVTALQSKGPFTVFAPSNAAFDKLPHAALERLLDPQNIRELVGILTYHVLPGSAVYSEDLKSTQKMTTLQGQDLLITSYSGVGVMIVGNSKVTAADKVATNGVVYIIDTVLMPPPIVTTPAPPMPTKDIVQLAQGSADLSTLVSALQVGGLVSVLQSQGPFTVFAPSNAAFKKLPKTVLDRLLEPRNKDELVGILMYHVLPGSAIYSKDLKPSQKITTLQGQGVLVTSFSAAGVSINGNSKVTVADIAAKNGVVHIIDTVLMPPKIIAPVQRDKIETSAEPARGECERSCSLSNTKWQVKCKWSNRCDGCSECLATSEIAVAAKPTNGVTCYKRCSLNDKTWKMKCTWSICSNCPECSVALSTKAVAQSTVQTTPEIAAAAKPTYGATCKKRCSLNDKTWKMKCTWSFCSGCHECSVALSTKAVAQSTVQKIAAAAKLTYGATCKKRCSLNDKNWDRKCTWLTCSGCAECSVALSTKAVAQSTVQIMQEITVVSAGCNKYCRLNNKSWKKKCLWSTCSNCAECSVALSTKAVAQSSLPAPEIAAAAKPTNGVICNKFCNQNEKNWKVKCLWSTCSGCAECSVALSTKAVAQSTVQVMPETRVVIARCNDFCTSNNKSWKKKCLWSTCSNCAECSAASQQQAEEEDDLPMTWQNHSVQYTKGIAIDSSEAGSVLHAAATAITIIYAFFI